VGRGGRPGAEANGEEGDPEVVSYTSVLRPALVGRRIMVRYADADGRLTDAVGDLLSWRGDTLIVRTRRGEVAVAESAIVAGQPVPEPTVRRAADIGVTQLHRIAARGWRPSRTAWVGGWLLRAYEGPATDVDAVLPLGDPGRPLDDALAEVVAWYAEQGSVARFQTPLPDQAALDDALAARGWPAAGEGVLSVTDVADVATAGGSPDVGAASVDPKPSSAWLAAWRAGRHALRPASLDVLTRHDRVAFVSVPGAPGTVARAVVDGEWVGVAAVCVAPDDRPDGCARLVSEAAIAWGAGGGARHAYAQIDADDTGELRLAQSLGFTAHAPYRYRSAPVGDA
jgi:N-acetylglutamate synthase